MSNLATLFAARSHQRSRVKSPNCFTREQKLNLLLIDCIFLVRWLPLKITVGPSL